MRNDIRTNKQAITLTHASARGKVKRNAGNFTRGSQLFHHEILMTWAGIRIPLYTWIGTTVLLLFVLGYFTFKNHEVHLVLMKLLSSVWGWMSLDPMKAINLTLPSGQIVQGTMAMVPYHPAVEAAWSRAIQVTVSSMLGAAFICVPLTIWFVDFSRKRGSEILTERHERGAVLVERPMLKDSILSHNWREHEKECLSRTPPEDPNAVLKEPLKQRIRRGLHQPYKLAGLPYPWRLEQSHAMFIGTTGAGKTTELKKLVTQARERGHRCVIFDLTGTFVESFYNEATDVILNPMDKRCQAWSIFNDCHNYAEFMSAATALVPSGQSVEDDFWQKSARTLMVEMCVKMLKMGVRSNGGLAYFLMMSDLKTIHAQLEGTVAGPMMSPSAAKMAESIRTTFIANAELKAMQAADLSGLPALADDSGLCVEALGGDPGLFSARWAGPDKDFNLAMQKVWDGIAAKGPDAGHDAHFVCALALAWPDGHVEAFEGRVDGTIVWPPRGDKGFGYDPMFQPHGHDISFGEMDPDAKHAMSHRAHAFAHLVKAVF